MKKLIAIAIIAIAFSCNKSENQTYQVTYTAYGKVFPYYVTYDNGIISNFVDTVRTTSFTKTISTQSKNKVMGINAKNILSASAQSDSLFVKIVIGSQEKHDHTVFLTNVQGSISANLTTPSK